VNKLIKISAGLEKSGIPHAIQGGRIFVKGKSMSSEQCKKETQEHIDNVAKYLNIISEELVKRAKDHDKSKLSEPELTHFIKYTPKLKTAKFGSEKYKSFLKGLKPALDHHYKVNRHHPEYFENGIKGMNLIDLLEMVCDWLAATKRTKDGDIVKSIDINQTRFGYSDELKQILIGVATLVKN
jgi:hypothetical protein